MDEQTAAVSVAGEGMKVALYRAALYAAVSFI